jgi:hypothetical protein
LLCLGKEPSRLSARRGGTRHFVSLKPKPSKQ